jgi:hypothetical protein
MFGCASRLPGALITAPAELLLPTVEQLPAKGASATYSIDPATPSLKEGNPLKSPGFNLSGPTIAPVDGFEWAIYEAGPFSALFSPQKLTVDVAGSTLTQWVGIADYSHNRWMWFELSPPYSTTVDLAIPAGQFFRPSDGLAFIALVVFDGAQLQLNGASLTPGDGQIYQGDYTINSAQTLTDFIPYLGITGSLTISGSELTNLDGLANLRFIGGTFNVGSSTLSTTEGLSNLEEIMQVLQVGGAQLTSLSLPQLKSVGTRMFISSSALASISLPKLAYVGGAMIIKDCPQMGSLEGFSALTALGGAPGAAQLTVENMDGLQDLDGLGGLSGTIYDLYIRENDNLTSLSGLGGIARVEQSGTRTGEMEIRNNAKLTNLSGLGVTFVGTVLWIEGNPLLSSTSGLDSLNEVGTLLINYSPALQNLNGLGSLAHLFTLRIWNSPLLKNLNGLDGLIVVDGAVDIEYTGIEDVDALFGLTGIGSSLSINHNDALLNVDGFSALLSIGQGITIESNAVLDNLDGFAKLNMICATGGGSLVVTANHDLRSVNGLAGLTINPGTGYVVNGDFTITENSLDNGDADAEGLLNTLGGAGKVSGVVTINLN